MVKKQLTRQGSGNFVPLGQKWPGLHLPVVAVSLGFANTALFSQKYLSWHSPEGYFRPIFKQYIPGRHWMQSAIFAKPVPLLNVPARHPTGVAVPGGQYDPSGQSRPVFPSVGVGVQEPPIQW